jgi:hypothetical protein
MHPLALRMQVMDALYLIKLRRRHTDLLFDQLKEICQLLAAEHRFKDAARTERQLEDLRHRWDAVKKAAPQVGSRPAACICHCCKAAVQPARSPEPDTRRCCDVIPGLQVRKSVKASQEAEGERVKADIERCNAAVAQYMGSVYPQRCFFSWTAGVVAATADIEKVGRWLVLCVLAPTAAMHVAALEHFTT